MCLTKKINVMKRLFSYFTIVLCLLTLIQSCKKDIATASNTDLLKQKWTWISETLTIPAYSQKNSRQVFSTDSYSDFRNDNKVYNYLHNMHDTAFYNRENDTLSFVLIQNGQKADSTNAKILTLSTNTLVLSFANIYYIEDSTGVETICTGVVIDSLKR